ncbi:putative invertase inhibitor [Prosopis cineraria]|uniref:putative invertase inhibitor n=1 Tax=Prosopis cineraria TaxID=364024 RepID=UPI00241023E4|nr:putative invertase inhibitor [Prosopis cineraria]XP_054810681.1 putative invertase inhibitor [Prosopis cineraria]
MSESSFLCLLFFVITVSTINAEDLIDQTCKKCENRSIILNYGLCSTSLQVIPVSHAANLQGLALIAMELALENATTTLSTIEKLMMNTTSLDGDDEELALRACLRDCLELYSDAAWRIMNSIGAFLSENYETTKTWMSSVMEAASTCQEGFAEKGEASPLTKENYNLFQLCGISLCIVHLSTPAIPS